MSSNSPSADPLAEMAFEEAMERLDEIVSEMEGERMPLDEMVSSYEEGVRLLNLCRQRIDGARKRVEMIHAGEAQAGAARLTEFDAESVPDETPAESKASAKASTSRRPKSSPAEAEGDDDEIRLF